MSHELFIMRQWWKQKGEKKKFSIAEKTVHDFVSVIDGIGTGNLSLIYLKVPKAWRLFFPVPNENFFMAN
jgi:hypothetical protein